MAVLSPSSDVEIYRVPFHGEDYVSVVGETFADLVDAYGVNRVLVLKRFPTGIETFTDRLATQSDEIERPVVSALGSHATSLVEEHSDDIEFLSEDARRELAYRFVAKRSWETAYLDAAAKQDSFAKDVVRLLNVFTWWGREVDSSHPVLAELADAHTEFTSYLRNHGYVSRGNAVPYATELLANNPDVRERVQTRFDGVLAIEYEEFGPTERRYLSTLTENLDLVCIGESNSSVQRIWNEPDDIRNWPATNRGEQTQQEEPNRPAAVAQFFATGETMAGAADGSVSVIDEQTFDDQVRTVADEIQRLRSEHGWGFDEFAVAFETSSGPIPETIRILRRAGIPTASATVSGFADDPAIRELLAVSRFLSSGDEESKSRLAARVATDPDPILERVRAASGLEQGFRTWAEQAELKLRIAENESPLEARTQFRHVREVFDLASFIDETQILDATWQTASEALERAFGHAAADTSTAATDVKDDGVLVDAIRVLKNASWKAVFVLNTVEGEYPSKPGLTRLFPETTLDGLGAFPGVTAPSKNDVQAAFQTAPDSMENPYLRYYIELSRRLLAVGSRAAEKKLYFGIFEEEDATTGKRTQPSRFLVDAYNQFPWIQTLEPDGAQGQSGITRFALSRVDQALVDIKRASSMGKTVDIDEIERDLATIQEILETEDGDQAYIENLRHAVGARVDFAAGRVRNE